MLYLSPLSLLSPLYVFNFSSRIRVFDIRSVFELQGSQHDVERATAIRGCCCHRNDRITGYGHSQVRIHKIS